MVSSLGTLLALLVSSRLERYERSWNDQARMWSPSDTFDTGREKTYQPAYW